MHMRLHFVEDLHWGVEEAEHTSGPIANPQSHVVQHLIDQMTVIYAVTRAYIVHVANVLWSDHPL